MKKIVLMFITCLITFLSIAQVPDKLSYQAIIRDNQSKLVKNETVGVRISILQGSVNGVSVYIEIQDAVTNINGLLTLEIGGSIGFADIKWGEGPYFFKTETDPEGGSNYTIIGVSQLLTVPYALHAKTAETVTGGISETDPVYEGSEAAKITEPDITNLGKLSGINTGDQDLNILATKTALGDSTAQVRSEIPNVSGFLTDENDPVYSASQAAKIKVKDITNLGRLSGTNTGDQNISGISTNASAITTIQSEQTTQNAAIALNTVKVGITTVQANAIIDNTGKDTTGIYHANRAALNAVSGVNTGDQDLNGIPMNTMAIKDTAAQIRANIPDVSKFLTSETDPTFTSSQAASITATDITNLSNLSGVNTGDQDVSTLASKIALVDSTAQVRSEIPDVSGFLTSYTETDPVYSVSQAASITATDITNLSNLSGVNTGDQDVNSFISTETDPVYTAWDKDYTDLTNKPENATPTVDGFMSNADKTKLDNMEENSNNYIHPSGDGNLHVPATGISNKGKILTAGATAGSLSWEELSLKHFTESTYNYDSKTGVKFLATNDSTNVDFIISPKGEGAIIAQQPDGTTAGGNNRGRCAVDLQMYREDASQVASGWSSVIVGGRSNTASGNFSTAMGFRTDAIGFGSVAMGHETTAPSGYETVIGQFNTDYTPACNNGHYIFAWNISDRLFVIGNGTSSSERSDAFTILKNANTSIGGSLAVNTNRTDSSYTFPIERGTNGQVLSTNGSGILSWATPATGTNLWESTGTDVYRASGKVGIGVAAPHAALQLSNETKNRKIVLFEDKNNDHQFYGLGINDYTFRYQIPATNASHVFYSGTSDDSSVELFRIKGSGEIAIPALSTAGVLHNDASGVLSSSFIVNTDISASATIADTKLATISTAGKVDNSATSATSANTANAIVARDASGNFSATTITASLSGNASSATTAITATNIIGGAQGSIPVQSAAGTTSLLPKGNEGQVLKMSSAGTPEWATESANSVTSVAGKTGDVMLQKEDVNLGNVEDIALSSWTGSNVIKKVGVINDGVWEAAPIQIEHGGTGATNKTEAFDALSPLTTEGDLIYGGTDGSASRLEKGSAQQMLWMNDEGTAPEWGNMPAAHILVMTQEEVVSIVNPSEGLMVYCTDCGLAGAQGIFDGDTWNYLFVSSASQAPATPVASEVRYTPLGDINWRWKESDGANSYKWNSTNDYSSAVTVSSFSGCQFSHAVDCNRSYAGYVWAVGSDGLISTPLALYEWVDEAETPESGDATLKDGSEEEIEWSWESVYDAVGYKISTTNNYAGATDLGLTTSYTQISVSKGDYTQYVWAYNSCGESEPLTLTITATLSAPVADNPVGVAPFLTWRWNAVPNASGYKWSTSNNYAAASDVAKHLSYEETDLVSGTSYTRYVWAYNNWGHSEVGELNGTPGGPATPDVTSIGITYYSLNYYWDAVEGATGYKISYDSPDYANATDIGNETTTYRDGLKKETSYTFYIWAYNGLAHSDYFEITVETCSLDYNGDMMRSYR